jgi:hypothetical protein
MVELLRTVSDCIEKQKGQSLEDYPFCNKNLIEMVYFFSPPPFGWLFPLFG